jgi:phosphocarrier protein
MGVMMLAASQGSMVTLEANGTDEQDAIAALSALIADTSVRANDGQKAVA